MAGTMKLPENNTPELPLETRVAERSIQLELRADGVAVVTFDQAERSANVFDRPLLNELGAVLGDLEHHEGLTGVIFRSAKPTVFIAGADLEAFRSLKDIAEVRRLVMLGQRTFQRIADLRVPTVAPFMEPASAAV